jgi:hypothetical protein
MVSVLGVTAAIIGVFFAVGILVGVLIVIAIPRAGRARLGGSQRPGSGPADQPGLSPPQWPAPTQPEDPDDREGYPWWPSPR